jgi:hypothetical protein
LCNFSQVSKKDLHAHNDFFGEHFRLCKVLRIPNNLSSADIDRIQPASRDVDVQRFRNESGLGVNEATYYLETNDWSYALAIEQFRGDQQWEREHVEGSAIAQQNSSSNHSKDVHSRHKQRAVTAAKDTRIAAVTGTSGADYSVADDGTIEMVAGDGAHIPLLSK